MSTLTAERLRELLHYDLDTGVFTRIARTSNRINVGDVAGTLDSKGYRQIRVDGRPYLAHRLAWLYVYGSWPDREIDHIDGAKDHNAIANLRLATHAENLQNMCRARADNLSGGLIGVTLDKSTGKFRARITVNGRQRFLGLFDTPELAHTAYLRAKSELHPFSTIPEAAA